MQVIKVRTPQNVTIEYKLASLGDRLLAHLFDIVVISAYFILLFYLNEVLLNNYILENEWLFIVVILPWFFYDLLCEVFMEGQSFGKKIMRIKVVRLDGAAVSLGNYLLRWLLGMIELRILGGLLAMFAIVMSGKGQRLGDMAAGTAVVRIQENIKQASLTRYVSSVNQPLKYHQAAQLSDQDISILKDVIATFNRTGNKALVEAAAAKVLLVMGVDGFDEKNAFEFVKQVLADYHRLVSNQ
ncbi:MAG: RDD family protein [Cytophagales bacterium]|nr:RDD family protein [Bernardetiaceae bacterium]MDW8205434.1 RDD family protein [Cytophagales bacterium]